MTIGQELSNYDIFVHVKTDSASEDGINNKRKVIEELDNSFPDASLETGCVPDYRGPFYSQSAQESQLA
jgi:2,3-bisphosphoglycerate-independent phosphoglycerate mutase